MHPLARTKASGLNVALFPCRSVWVGVSKRRSGADMEILVETPLLGTRETGLVGIIWDVEM